MTLISSLSVTDSITIVVVSSLLITAATAWGKYFQSCVRDLVCRSWFKHKCAQDSHELVELARRVDPHDGDIEVRVGCKHCSYESEVGLPNPWDT